MESLVVECLRCGTSRIAHRDVFKHFESPECPECGYLGWTQAREPAEDVPPRPRERRVARRLTAA